MMVRTFRQRRVTQIHAKRRSAGVDGDLGAHVLQAVERETEKGREAAPPQTQQTP